MTTNKKKYVKRKKRAQAHKAAESTSKAVSSDTLKRPNSFPSMVDVVSFSKGAVYSITRMRQVGGTTYTGTIGTGFLCGPNRFVTCAHVMSNKQNKAAFAHHVDGDMYYLLSKDEDGQQHWHRVTPHKDKDLHIYPDIDLAVLELSDEFYYRQGKVLQSKGRYIPLCSAKNVLATEVGVIGYPLEKDDKGQDMGVYLEAGTSAVKTENIRVRADTGVVNASYKDAKDSDVAKYEFTMAFNPGNSGGPILNKDGCAVAIVHGYKAFPINVIEEKFVRSKPDGTKENFSIPATIRATYSIGISSENFMDLASRHQLMTC